MLNSRKERDSRLASQEGVISHPMWRVLANKLSCPRRMLLPSSSCQNRREKTGGGSARLQPFRPSDTDAMMTQPTSWTIFVIPDAISPCVVHSSESLAESVSNHRYTMSLVKKLVGSVTGGDRIVEEKRTRRYPIAVERRRGGVEETKDEEEKKDSEYRDDSSSFKEAVEPGIEIADLSGNHVPVDITNLVPSFHFKDPPSERSKSRRSEEGSICSASVNFGSVQVREYERVIDSTSIYMGLALGWNYSDQVPTPIREKDKTSKYSLGSDSHGGESRMKRTNGSDRYGMMIRYGYAQKELKEATKEAAKFYKQRQREAARSLVVADQRNKQEASSKPKRRPLLRSMFG